MSAAPTVTIHTDGSCLGNPGPGGYGVILDYQGRRKELSGGYALTTNNRMELLAAIIGLEALTRPCDVTLYSDSNVTWSKPSARDGPPAGVSNGWMRNKREAAVNPRPMGAAAQRSGTPQHWNFAGCADTAAMPENERCDRLANEAARQNNLPEDPGYPPADSRRMPI